jgi:hypothetical protein
LIVGAVKAHAAGCEPVDVRCFGHGIAVAAERVREIVDGDENEFE